MASRVLLVEDVPDVRLLVRSALVAVGGFDVIEAPTGGEAIDLAAADNPDVVVLDLGLPDLAAEHVLAGIRRAAPESKVVIYTGAHPDPGSLVGVAGFVSKDAGVEELVQLVRSVTNPPQRQATMELPKADASVAAARRFVADLLEQWDLAGLADDALLVTSELATNAVTHAASACRLTVAQNPASVRIEVMDAGAGVPDPRIARSTDENGRGLLIVTALSAAWGLDAAPAGGKVVWAELATAG